MTDHDVLSRLAAANPVSESDLRGAEDSQRAQTLLWSVVTRDRGRRRWPRWQFVAIPVSVVAAAAVFWALLPAPARVPVPAPPSLASPQSILSAAADRVGTDSGPEQFVHVAGTTARALRAGPAGYTLVRVDEVHSMHPAAGQPGEGWLAIGEAGVSVVQPLTPADATAWAAAGRPGAADFPVPATLYPDLAGDHAFEGDVHDLPGDPAQTAAAMLATGPVPADPQGWLFRQGTRLLDTFTEVVSGGDRAKLFRMLAGLSGVRTLPGGTDPLGRHATGLAYTAVTERYGTLEWQIYIGAESDKIVYSQAVVRVPGTANSGLHPGDVQYSTAVTSVTWSDKP